MRVLLIDVNCKNSSTGKIVYDLYTYLNDHGNIATVCYGRGPKLHEKNIYKFGIDIETYLHAFLARITGYNGCFSYYSTKRLINYIEKFKPDMIHIHELHAYFVNIGTLINYIKKKQIPVVWTFHCEYMYTGKCGHAYDCENWKVECDNCPMLSKYPKSIFFDRTKEMFNFKKKLLLDFDFTIITPSEWLAKRVRESFLSNKTIKVIHNGIDTDKVFYIREKKETTYLYDKYGIDKIKKIVISVAPNIMDERKGGTIILEIAKEMKEFQFILVGTDETKKYSNNVLLIKKINNQNELARLYSIADLFLICSKKENFPTTCIEAMSCGLPVVGIDEGGTKETVPNPYGLFVKNDINDIKNAIDLQMDKRFNKKDIRDMAVKLYSKDKFGGTVINTFLELL